MPKPNAIELVPDAVSEALATLPPDTLFEADGQWYRTPTPQSPEVAHGRPQRAKPQPTADRKLRPCLRCGVEFMSEWAGHRRCPSCAGSDEVRGSLEVPVDTGRRL